MMYWWSGGPDYAYSILLVSLGHSHAVRRRFPDYTPPHLTRMISHRTGSFSNTATATKSLLDKVPSVHTDINIGEDRWLKMGIMGPGLHAIYLRIRYVKSVSS